MARVIVKVGIPRRNPDEMITLTNKLLERHNQMGDKSPLRDLGLDQIQVKLKTAKEKRDEARMLHKKAEMLNQEAELDLGIADFQNSTTAGTIYNALTRSRDILLGIHKGQEENLNDWGFEVASTTVRMKKRKKTETEG